MAVKRVASAADRDMVISFVLVLFSRCDGWSCVVVLGDSGAPTLVWFNRYNTTVTRGYDDNINRTIPYSSMAKEITDHSQAGTSGIRGTARVRMFGEDS